MDTSLFPLRGFVKTHSRVLVLISVLAVALAARLCGIGFGLPYTYHPDEPAYVQMAQRMLKTGDINPHFFNYPSLFFYLNALAYLPYYLLGRIAGVFHTPADILPPEMLAMGVGRVAMPTTFLLGRLLTAVFGAATAALAALTAWRFSPRASVGLAAGILVAVAPIAVTNSRYVTPDAFVTFFVTLDVLLSVLLWQTGRTRFYVAAGLVAGLAASTKYNGGLVLLIPLLAHLLRARSLAFADRRFWVLIGLALLGFVAASPYVLLDFHKFSADFSFERQHYATGHSGMEGNTLAWYLGRIWVTEGIIALLAGFELLLALRRRSCSILLLIAFPLVYFAIVSALPVRNDRTLLLMLPLLIVAGALLPQSLSECSLRPQIRRPLMVAVSVLLIGAVVQSAAVTAREASRLVAADGREAARVWIESNLPHGSRIAFESYAPFLAPGDYQLLAVGSMLDQPLDWYRSQRADYLVFSQGMYGRFFAEPDRYALQVQEYQALWSECDQLRSFPDGAYEVRVCHLRRS